jgi:uridine phosphorylase
MSLPKIKNKHQLQPMFSMGFLMRTVPEGLKLPKKAIIVYANSIEQLFQKELDLERMKVLEDAVVNYNTLSIYKSRAYDLLVVRLAIGAPLTAMIAEDIIRLGVREILIIGEAGGIRQDLSPGGIVLCTKAMRDTGTSEHYMKSGRYVNADRELVVAISRSLKKAGVEFALGPTWSIDAPYTETRDEVEKYSDMGILTVEMESAGLFAVANKRGARACAVFVVSDVLRLDSGWSGFDSGELYAKGFAKLPQIARVFAQTT